MVNQLLEASEFDFHQQIDHQYIVFILRSQNILVLNNSTHACMLYREQITVGVKSYSKLRNVFCDQKCFYTSQRSHGKSSWPPRAMSWAYFNILTMFSSWWSHKAPWGDFTGNKFIREILFISLLSVFKRLKMKTWRKMRFLVFLASVFLEDCTY